MSRSAGTDLPDELLGLLGGKELGAKVGVVFLLLTVRDDGWPHQTMLSVGEVLAVDPTRMLLALWPTSTATRNLDATRRATLTCVVDGTSYAVRVAVTALGELRLDPEVTRAAFDATVEEVLIDTAPYAVLESGVRYRLIDERETLERWERTVAALRLLPPPGAGRSAS